MDVIEPDMYCGSQEMVWIAQEFAKCTGLTCQDIDISSNLTHKSKLQVKRKQLEWHALWENPCLVEV